MFGHVWLSEKVCSCLQPICSQNGKHCGPRSDCPLKEQSNLGTLCLVISDCLKKFVHASKLYVVMLSEWQTLWTRSDCPLKEQSNLDTLCLVMSDCLKKFVHASNLYVVRMANIVDPDPPVPWRSSLIWVHYVWSCLIAEKVRSCLQPICSQNGKHCGPRSDCPLKEQSNLGTLCLVISDCLKKFVHASKLYVVMLSEWQTLWTQIRLRLEGAA